MLKGLYDKDSKLMSGVILHIYSIFKKKPLSA